MYPESPQRGNMAGGWHRTSIRVRYKDTDRMGVVYYGNYLTYFEVGRAEFMRHLGFPYSRLEEEGYNLVVVEAKAKYYANVGYDELIYVNTSVGEIRKVRIRFDYRITNQNGRLLVEGYTVHACIDTRGKPSRLPEKLISIFPQQKIKS